MKRKMKLMFEKGESLLEVNYELARLLKAVGNLKIENEFSINVIANDDSMESSNQCETLIREAMEPSNINQDAIDNLNNELQYAKYLKSSSAYTMVGAKIPKPMVFRLLRDVVNGGRDDIILTSPITENFPDEDAFVFSKDTYLLPDFWYEMCKQDFDACNEFVAGEEVLYGTFMVNILLASEDYDNMDIDIDTSKEYNKDELMEIFKQATGDEYEQYDNTESTNTISVSTPISMANLLTNLEILKIADEIDLLNSLKSELLNNNNKTEE